MFKTGTGSLFLPMLKDSSAKPPIKREDECLPTESSSTTISTLCMQRMHLAAGIECFKYLLTIKIQTRCDCQQKSSSASAGKPRTVIIWVCVHVRTSGLDLSNLSINFG